MSDDIADFLQQTKTDIAAVQYNAAAAFLRVWIVPAIDLERLLQVPRWPAALINDAGGTLDAVNGRVWTRRMDVTVIDCVPRDHVGEESILAVLNRGEALVAALEWNRTDGIFLAADSDVDAVAVDADLMLVTKTYTFQYQILRA